MLANIQYQTNKSLISYVTRFQLAITNVNIKPSDIILNKALCYSPYEPEQELDITIAALSNYNAENVWFRNY